SRGDSRSDSRGGNKSYRSDKPRSEGKSFGDKPYRSDKPRSEGRSFSKKPHSGGAGKSGGFSGGYRKRNAA
ncbi:MAG: pseudouridine synthase, partial [Alphaproteobacteria bacterium]|nr:pseudouridine synthase [Alphaproteobacteria bacterium]